MVYIEDGDCEDIPVSELPALLQPMTEKRDDSCSVERLNHFGVEWQTKHLFKDGNDFVCAQEAEELCAKKEVLGPQVEFVYEQQISVSQSAVLKFFLDEKKENACKKVQQNLFYNCPNFVCSVKKRAGPPPGLEKVRSTCAEMCSEPVFAVPLEQKHMDETNVALGKTKPVRHNVEQHPVCTALGRKCEQSFSFLFLFFQVHFCIQKWLFVGWDPPWFFRCGN